MSGFVSKQFMVGWGEERGSWVDHCRSTMVDIQLTLE